MSRYRTLQRVIPAPETLEGDGVVIHRAFPNHELSELDPFLLLDHMGPVELRPGEARGFPDHPHRGFETVTYLLHGDFQHRDSFGHKGVLNAGDVQWMTAGSGLVHSETPGENIRKNGGRLEGFQLWVNLPKRDKMKAPHYQELSAANIPVAKSADGSITAKVIAGEAFGVQGGVSTHIPIQYIHFLAQKGATSTHVMPRGLNGFLYVIDGALEVQGKTIPQFHLGSLANDADEIEFTAKEATSFLLLAAEPIHEPVARYGPFVMNTKLELQQAFEDYRDGKMGTISA